MFFNFIKEINRLRKQVNRLLSKGMSNICLKVLLRRSQNFSVLGSSNSRRYHSVLKLLVATYKSDVWEQNCAWLFYYFNFERSHDVSKSNGPCILRNKDINFNDNETESKMENTMHIFRETNLVLQLI